MISASEFEAHRRAMIKIFRDQNVDVDHVVIKGTSEPEEPFTGSELGFLQEAFVFWLTGWNLPNVTIDIDIHKGESTLIIPPYEDKYEIWSGEIPTEESVKKQTGVNHVLFTDSYEVPRNSFVLDTSNYKTPTVEGETIITAATMARKIKTSTEIEQIEAAAIATSKALENTMKFCKPGMTEKMLEHRFVYEGGMLGCDDVSFKTISASGKNAVYLHYKENSSVVKDGDLVLFDCGFFKNHYAGDVTRTFPANGKFTEIQERVYSLLLDMQISLCNEVRPGTTIKELNDKMFAGIFKIVKDLKLVPQDAEYSYDIARLFCPHSLTHHVGCNVHDFCYTNTSLSLIKYSLDEQISILPNMVITIEPGIYFHEVRFNKCRNDPIYSGVDFDKAIELSRSVGGIRIEDDVLVTETGRRVLSTCPKTVESLNRCFF